MDAIIKKAELQDLETLNKISVESKRYWNYPEEWIKKWKDELTITTAEFTNQSIYKLICQESIVGFCSMNETETNYNVLHLWVRPKFIGKGLGKFLLNETLSKVVIKNKDIVLEADPNAEKFYQSQGFETFDKIESYPKGRYLPVMKKKTSIASIL